MSVDFGRVFRWATHTFGLVVLLLLVVPRAASAGSLRLSMELAHPHVYLITATGTYDTSPTELDVFVTRGGGACPGTKTAELMTMESQVQQFGPTVAGEPIYVRFGTNVVTSGNYSEPAYWGVDAPDGIYSVCGYLLIPPSPTRDPADPPQAMATGHFTLGPAPRPGPQRRGPCGASTARFLAIRSDRQPPWTVGEKITLTARCPRNSLSRIRWYVQGATDKHPTVVKSYANSPFPHRPDGGEPVAPDARDLSQHRVSFYLTGNASPRLDVTLTAAVGTRRTPARASVRFSVESPAVNMNDIPCKLDAANTDLGLPNQHYPEFGLGFNDHCAPPDQAGMSWHIKVDPPQSATHTGRFALLQTISHKLVEQRFLGHRKWKRCDVHFTPGAIVDDSASPPFYVQNHLSGGPGHYMNNFGPREVILPPHASEYWNGFDSPGMTLTTWPGSPFHSPAMPLNTERFYTESFQDHLMYQPSGGIWVSVGELAWSFAGHVQLIAKPGGTGTIAIPTPGGPTNPEVGTFTLAGHQSDAAKLAGALPYWDETIGRVQGDVTC